MYLSVNLQGGLFFEVDARSTFSSLNYSKVQMRKPGHTVKDGYHFNVVFHKAHALMVSNIPI